MDERILAAVQPLCVNGDPRGNLARAERLVADAAQRGAHLVLAPELLASGYAFEPALWDHAEPFEGRTLEWVRAVSTRHGMHVGTSLLEVRDDDFVNTFVLVDPAGEVEGVVRKDRVPTFETLVCRSVPGPHVIESTLGRIGVAICAESLRGFVLAELRHTHIDLVLMPHATSGGRHVAFGVRATPVHFARELGVPVVLANKVGQVRTRLPPLPRVQLRLSFRGGSSVTDRDGNAVDRLGPVEGVAVARVRTGKDAAYSVSHRSDLRMELVTRLSRLAAPVEILGDRMRLRNPQRVPAARALRDADAAASTPPAEAPGNRMPEGCDPGEVGGG